MKITKMFYIVIALILVAIVAYFLITKKQQTVTKDTLTNESLLEYMRNSYDKETMVFKTITIGTYHNTEVIAEFVCGDICPQATRRIVRYNVTADKCSTTDGVIVKATYPIAIAVQKRDICVPKILQNYEQ